MNLSPAYGEKILVRLEVFDSILACVDEGAQRVSGKTGNRGRYEKDKDISFDHFYLNLMLEIRRR